MQHYNELLIKRLTDTATLPTYAHNTDSGMDLYYDGEDITIHPTYNVSKPYLLSTGISIQLPKDTEAQIRSRSGLTYKNSIVVANSPGTIDEGYTGEIKVLIFNFSSLSHIIKRGDRIAQMVIAPVIRTKITEVFELNETKRGGNGFGSTGV